MDWKKLLTYPTVASVLICLVDILLTKFTTDDLCSILLFNRAVYLRYTDIFILTCIF